MRVVLDTNVLLSACLKPDGLEARTVQLALEGALEPCATAAVWAEYRDVLLREKFAAFRERAESVLGAMDARVVRVSDGATVAVASDEDDNRFLECAVSAGAAYLITGNLRHYPAEYGGARVVNARGFFTICEELAIR
jgi:putative PIN family toxin of toxin-antitoxin system